MPDPTPEALTELKTICKNLAGHPKCPMYAASYVQAIPDGKVESAAKRNGDTLSRALVVQFSYIMSNMAVARNRQVIAMKKQLQAWQAQHLA